MKHRYVLWNITLYIVCMLSWLLRITEDKILSKKVSNPIKNSGIYWAKVIYRKLTCEPPYLWAPIFMYKRIGHRKIIPYSRNFPIFRENKIHYFTSLLQIKYNTGFSWKRRTGEEVKPHKKEGWTWFGESYFINLKGLIWM